MSDRSQAVGAHLAPEHPPADAEDLGADPLRIEGGYRRSGHDAAVKASGPPANGSITSRAD